MGCSNSSTAANSSVWAELKQRLPLDRTPEQQKKRDILFAKFDEKKVNSLSEEDCLKGCRVHLELDKLTNNLALVNKRAFNAACSLRTRADATSNVDPAEFRLFLQYIREYFELNVMFEEVDTTSDRVVTLAEFKNALPRIEKWGLRVKNPEEEFKKMDRDGNGVSFEEFSDWAIRHNLDAEKDTAAGNVPAKKDAPAATAAAPAPAAAAPAPAAAAPAPKAEEKKAEAAAAPAPKAEEKKAEAAAPAPKAEEKKVEAAAPAPKAEEKKAEAAAPAPAAQHAPVVEEKKVDTHAPAPAPAHAPEAAHAPEPAHAPAAEKAIAVEEIKAEQPAHHGLSEAAARRKNVWADLKTRLPRKKTPEQNDARTALFNSFDPNGNGYLSYAEIERGCKNILKLDEFTDELDPILIRAYNTARNARKGDGANASTEDAYVERVEFRLLLVYIYDFFELRVAFDEIDSTDDNKVSAAEFKLALPKFQKWGVKGIDESNIAEEFSKIDKNGSGTVTFVEFAEWAIAKHLDVDGEDNQK